jgi:DNA-binding NtrC family response regulator
VPLAITPEVLYLQQQPADGEVDRLLHAMGARVTHCALGSEALDIAASRSLSCVLAPARMADMSATTLIDSLHHAAPGLKVIVIVDNPAVSEAVEVMQFGAHAVVDSRRLSAGLYHHVAPLLRAE